MLYSPCNIYIYKYCAARRYFIGGFGGMPPRENFFKWCNLVRFWCIFGSDFAFKKFQKLLFFI